jgi:hypothetical protein
MISTYRFISESFKQTAGDTFGEKMRNLSATWLSLSSEEKEVCCLIS